MSLRYLHKLFEAQPTGVAAWSRRRRLERCRHDLLYPALREHSVTTIAARWGLTNPAHFSRCFRDAYGVAPAAFRAVHLVVEQNTRAALSVAARGYVLQQGRVVAAGTSDQFSSPSGPRTSVTRCRTAERIVEGRSRGRRGPHKRGSKRCGGGWWRWRSCR